MVVHLVLDRGMSQMSQSRMSVAGQSQFRKHRSPRILQNEVRETPSIPVRRVRKDVLLDERDAERLCLVSRPRSGVVHECLRWSGGFLSGKW